LKEVTDMSQAKMLDPVCDMVVGLADARDHGLTLERPERDYAFCAHNCLMEFAKSPQGYIPKVDAWLEAQAGGEHTGAHAHSDAAPVIDDGMREWYKSCRCCLSEAHPTIVEQLDAEKAQAAGH